MSGGPGNGNRSGQNEESSINDNMKIDEEELKTLINDKNRPKNINEVISNRINLKKQLFQSQKKVRYTSFALYQKDQEKVASKGLNAVYQKWRKKQDELNVEDTSRPTSMQVSQMEKAGVSSPTSDTMYSELRKNSNSVQTSIANRQRTIYSNMTVSEPYDHRGQYAEDSQ